MLSEAIDAIEYIFLYNNIQYVYLALKECLSLE
jgi:hypothetical protein